MGWRRCKHPGPKISFLLLLLFYSRFYCILKCTSISSIIFLNFLKVSLVPYVILLQKYKQFNIVKEMITLHGILCTSVGIHIIFRQYSLISGNGIYYIISDIPIKVFILLIVTVSHHCWRFLLFFFTKTALYSNLFLQL